ncbi:site-specific DNA-methyltransferase [Salmonella enterica subsp. enterica serovar Eastbourne]|uniref:Methyltransferase n=1 Tax=Salmonella enterica subsp. enterica serovar Eastbourne TaxID=486993 RepID=A0A702F8J1_SALET|nr:site-specific DNA-methyltransferase [Salmonella enterica subsp. enterica serovar Eastbourne]ECA1898090.1 site-specific DNA-methyltransferase [Salmonella enterica subsp. enterica serovar Eastbourne]HAC6674897.1 site-specific DNA-methyltransferase [Salmonella enterica subsp. enterica serovar Eastbourne]HAE5115446.1 site-specific DNA-methyltransferase [Salmonella enterica subsp. enterica serovar Eastbourne]HAE8026549.1 site-specific DNA-methyltransferase [Salmonella enterica subsp. enterica ser
MSISLHHGDCLNIMPKLQPGSVDLILCDPPYGTMKGAGLDTWDDKTTQWDTTIEPAALFAACERVLRVNGALILFAQEPYTSRLITQAHNNLPFSYRLMWKKEHFGNPLTARNAPVSYFEDVVVFSKVERYDPERDHPLRDYARQVATFAGITATQTIKALGHMGATHFLAHEAIQFTLPTRDTYSQLITMYNLTAMPGFLTYDDMQTIHAGWKASRRHRPRVFNLPEGKKHKSNVLEYARDREKYHPTQKPVALLEDLIQTYSTPGDTVLDFTMGSGSTGVASINTGRRFIGIEKERKYFDIAVTRTGKAKAEAEKADGKVAA